MSSPRKWVKLFSGRREHRFDVYAGQRVPADQRALEREERPQATPVPGAAESPNGASIFRHSWCSTLVAARRSSFELQSVDRQWYRCRFKTAFCEEASPCSALVPFSRYVVAVRTS
jgi:hypothetical protein